MPVGDCERLVDGLLMQPVNALSSLCFVLAGGLVPVAVRRKGTPVLLGAVFGFVLALVGVGSLLFHGPGGSLAGWVHDGSITALLVLVLAIELGRRTSWSIRQVLVGWTVTAAGLVLAEGIWPQIGDPLNAPLALFAVVGVAGPNLDSGRLSPFGRPTNRERGAKVGMIMLAGGAIVMLLSRTGGPLCGPEALIQGHAIWHLLAAAGLGLYAVSVSVDALPPGRAREA